MLRSSAQSLSRGVARSTVPRRISPAFNLSTGPPGSSSSSGSSGAKVLVATGITAVTVVGGTLGFAAFDRDFRRWVEESVPGSSTAFSAVLGEPEAEKPVPSKKPAKPPVTAVPSSKKRPISESVTVSTTQSSELAAPASPNKKAEGDNVSLVPPPPLEKPSFLEHPGNKDAQRKEELSAVLPSQEEKKPLGKEPAEETKAVHAAEHSDKLSGEKVSDELLLSTEDIVDLHDHSSFVLAEKDLHRRVTEIRADLETQMVKQLKRQAEAHSDHINDALEIQKKELTRKFVRELDEALETATLAHQDELSGLMGHLRGLDESLQHRSNMDAASLEAQELWLACTAMLNAVASGSSTAEVRPLLHELAAVKKVVDTASDNYVKAVIESVPDEAGKRGIYTEDSIKERFFKVEKLARRTAMISEEGGSIFKYFLSYIQSMLLFDPSTEEMPSKEAPVDVNSLNTFDLVWLARGSLDRGDLDQAVRYMTLLKGEPRNIAMDWLREARLLLETKQACLALMSHAAAVGVEALPGRK